MESMFGDIGNTSIYDNPFINTVLAEKKERKIELARKNVSSMGESLLRHSDKSPNEGMRDYVSILNKNAIIADLNSSVLVGAMRAIDTSLNNTGNFLRDQFTERLLLIEIGKKGMPHEVIQNKFGDNINRVLRVCVESINIHEGNIEAGLLCFKSLLKELKKTGSLDDAAYAFALTLHGEVKG